MKKLLVALLLMYPLTAVAETYEWTDQQGTVHFTEDLGTVPKKYRKRVKKLGGDEGGAAQTTVTSEPATPAKGEAKVEEADRSKKVYGGRDESSWRNAFKSARGEVQRAESDLATLRGRLSDTSKMSRSEYLAIQNTAKHTEVRVQELQRRLELLQQSADRAGVPMEFRQ